MFRIDNSRIFTSYQLYTLGCKEPRQYFKISLTFINNVLFQMPVNVTNAKDIKNLIMNVEPKNVASEELWEITPMDYLLEDVSQIPKNHIDTDIYYHFITTLNLYLYMAGGIRLNEKINTKFNHTETELLDTYLSIYHDRDKYKNPPESFFLNVNENDQVK